MPGLVLVAFVSALAMSAALPPAKAASAREAARRDGAYVLVIDPGHGGENNGAIYELDRREFVEKEMNLVVALAMKEELEKYDGINVYLTREDSDTDISLRERAAIAADLDADFLISLHFNMSERQLFFGSETWVSAFDTFYANGHALAQLQQAAMREMGLFDRGIKTRLNDRDDDYYGIIRESRRVGINAVLIEFCHLDNAVDWPFYSIDDGQWAAFGRASATAAAQYFRLRSDILWRDFSDFAVPEVAVPTDIVRADLTPPDLCRLELLELDEETRLALFGIEAIDYDSQLLYYGFSLDGGEEIEALQLWPDGDALTVSVNLPPERDLQVTVAVFNSYDRMSLSNVIDIAALPPDPPPQTEAIVLAVDEAEIVTVSLAELTEELADGGAGTDGWPEMYRFFMVAGLALTLLVAVTWTARQLNRECR